MSVKQLALITAASVVALTSVSFAGGATAAPAASDAGVYVDVNVGAGFRDIKDDSSFTKVSATTAPTYKNGTSGFTVGADLGYQFNKTWAVEVAYQWQDDSKITVNHADTIFVGQDGAIAGVAANDYFKVKTYFIDAALKGSMPVMDSVSAYAKLGVAYSHNEVDFSDNGTIVSQDTNYWNPMFAVGLAYHIDHNWNVALEYSFIPGGDTWAKVAADQMDITTAQDAGAHHFPATQAVKVSAGYFFAM